MPRTGEIRKYIQNQAVSQSTGRLSSRVVDFSSFLERDLDERVAIYHSKMEFEQQVEVVDQETKRKGPVAALGG
jgi:hypothetical protein